MNVLHICVNFYHQLFHTFVKEIDKFDVKQTIFYPYQKKWNINISFDDYKNINYKYAKILNLFSRISYLYKLNLVKKEITKRIEFSDYNIIHAHTLFSDGGITYEIYKKRKIPYIVAFRQSDVSFLKYKPWLYFYGKKILENSSRIICLSPTLKIKLNRYYGKKFEEKIEVIPNGIDSEFINKSENKVKLLKTDTIINLVYVGSFIKRKNLHKIIEYVNNANGRFILNVVGGGGEKKYIEKINRLIKNSKFVKYYGIIENRKKLIDIYDKSNIFILPSINETFGITYIEAMSQGIPVLYVKGTGIYNYFKKDNPGEIVDVNDYSTWDSAIDKVLTNYAFYSKNGIKHSKMFSWAKISQKYFDLYKKIT